MAGHHRDPCLGCPRALCVAAGQLSSYNKLIKDFQCGYYFGATRPNPPIQYQHKSEAKAFELAEGLDAFDGGGGVVGGAADEVTQSHASSSSRLYVCICLSLFFVLIQIGQRCLSPLFPWECGAVCQAKNFWHEYGGKKAKDASSFMKTVADTDTHILPIACVASEPLDKLSLVITFPNGSVAAGQGAWLGFAMLVCVASSGN
jgi:hypothetical protein